jgi:MAP3K TRAFs-binding domain/Adenylate and Guanylate cyclase catalytic domain
MPDDGKPWLDEARSHAAAGNFLLAYDVAMRGLAEHPQDPALKHAAVLSLARSGATAAARERYHDFGLGDVGRADVSPSLHTDIASLDARIAKDLALAADSDQRRQLLAEAARRYRKVFDETGEYYPGVNAATLTLLAGHPAEAKALALSVRAICERRLAQGLESGYYVWATVAEASLVAGDETAVAQALAEARSAADAKPDALATTRRQLRGLCAATGASMSLLDELRSPTVVYYTGHLIGPRLSDAQAEALVPRIADMLGNRDVGVGFGSLASGADIVIAEALLARGAALELVFPFQLDEFREVSVRPAGPAWVERFDRCLARARSTTFATDDAYLGDEYLFTYASRLGIGLALQRAWSLDTERRLLAVWDGGGPGGALRASGAAVNVGIWRSLDLPGDVLTPNGLTLDPAQTQSPGTALEISGARTLRAMLFGDIKGFSKLLERQIPVFVDKVLGAIATTLDRYSTAIDHRNTWGDGLYVVIRDAETAADCALALGRAIAELPLAELGLPTTLGLRLGGHFGPVFQLHDPVIRQTVFMGRHVSRTARLEPVTPEGVVYVTDAFAAAIAATRQPRFACSYVGMMSAAKDYGLMRMFALTRRTAGQAV